jgi:hypothetical protein
LFRVTNSGARHIAPGIRIAKTKNVFHDQSRTDKVQFRLSIIL